MNVVATIAFLLAPTAVPAGGEATGPDAITIHLSAREMKRPGGEEKKALQKELRTRAEAAREELKALEKEAKQRFGKQREQWPPGNRGAVERAEEKSAQATLQLQYLDSDPGGVSDSVQDIRESLAGKGTAGVKEHVREVPTLEEADLVVELLGRRSVKGQPDPILPVPLDDFYVWMRVSAGGRTDPGRLGKVPIVWPGTAQLVHSWADAEPYWEFEVQREGRWANLGNEASRVLNTLAEKCSSEIASSRRVGP